MPKRHALTTLPIGVIAMITCQREIVAQTVVTDGAGQSALVRRIPLDPEWHTRPAVINLNAVVPYVMVARRGGRVDLFLLDDDAQPTMLSVDRSLGPAAVSDLTSLDGSPESMFCDSEGGVIRLTLNSTVQTRAERFPLLQAATAECWESLRSNGIPETEEFVALFPLRIDSCAFSDRGTLVCLSYGDGTVDIRDSRTGNLKHAVRGFTEVRHLDVAALSDQFGLDIADVDVPDEADREFWPWWLRSAGPDAGFEEIRVVYSSAAGRTPRRSVVAFLEETETIILYEQMRLYALDLLNNEVIWERPWIPGPLKRDTSELFACARDDITIFKMNAASGEVNWQATLPTPTGARKGGRAFSISDDRTRVAVRISRYSAVVYDVATGEVIWNSREMLPREPRMRRNIIAAQLSGDGHRIVVVDLGAGICEFEIGAIAQQ